MINTDALKDWDYITEESITAPLLEWLEANNLICGKRFHSWEVHLAYDTPCQQFVWIGPTISLAKEKGQPVKFSFNEDDEVEVILKGTVDQDGDLKLNSGGYLLRERLRTGEGAVKVASYNPAKPKEELLQNGSRVMLDDGNYPEPYKVVFLDKVKYGRVSVVLINERTYNRWDDYVVLQTTENYSGFPSIKLIDLQETDKDVSIAKIN